MNHYFFIIIIILGKQVYHAVFPFVAPQLIPTIAQFFIT